MKLSFGLFQIFYKGDLLEWLLLPMVLRCGVNEALTPHLENPFGKHLTHSKNFFPRRSEKQKQAWGRTGNPRNGSEEKNIIYQVDYLNHSYARGFR